MRRDNALLKDILDAINAVEAFVGGKDKKEFFKSDLLQSAVMRKLEIIGEAVKNLSPELKKSYPQVPWKDIAGMRDKLIHGYFGINIERVWETVKQALPELKENVIIILKEL